MKVKVAKKIYQMGRKEFEGLLKVAGEQVPRGIYAIQKGDYAELMNEKTTITQGKALKRQLKAQGYKVYSNGI